jgi:hypothetical protein
MLGDSSKHSTGNSALFDRDANVLSVKRERAGYDLKAELITEMVMKGLSKRCDFNIVLKM